jgi:hypothetical protein
VAESTLSITYIELRLEIGKFLGYGVTVTSWQQSQKDDVDSIIKSGLRQFYYPDKQGAAKPHCWRFMKPIMAVTTEASVPDIEMPSYFAGIDGDLTFKSDNGACEIPIVGEGMIRANRQGNSSSGRPMMAALVAAQMTPDAPQRWRLMLWPTPDSAYTFEFSCFMVPEALTEKSPYPLGGAVHGETILESCLALAEERKNGGPGLHSQKYQTRLDTSKYMDGKMGTQFFGQMGDAGDPSDYVNPREVSSVNFTATLLS